MIGLKIAGVSLVLFITGCILHAATKENRPGYKTPTFIALLGVAGVLGVPLGLIIAIIRV